MSRLRFQIDGTASGSRARAARFVTLHGEVTTPIFMPVGTQATVKGLTASDLEEVGARMLLANAYHLLLRPGVDVFAKIGGIHRFMSWRRPVLTDSGGYQVFSLANERVVTEEGAVFRSYVDGARIVLSPERSIEAQLAIGSDVMMVMDECVASTSDHATAAAAMHRTHRWAARSLAARGEASPALFGIVQGACFDDLRRESAAHLIELPFDGYAIGGLAVGEEKEERERCTALTSALLPAHLPRYLMGVGTPLDLLEAVDRGMDMFDCTMPSILAKQGVAFTSKGRLNVSRGVYKLAEDVLDAECPCSTCAHYSRAYLHHLIKTAEPLGWQLLTKHNLRLYHDLMHAMRTHILDGTFAAYRDAQRSVLGRGDEEHPSVIAPRRQRHDDEPSLDGFAIRRTLQGHATVVHLASGEMMHGGLDPSEEADSLYVRQSRLLERADDPTETPLVVWDVGLGSAYNAMAAIRAYESAESAPRRPLTLVSFEHDVTSLRLALRHATRFPHLYSPAPGQILRSGQWRSPRSPVEWMLREGDFRTQMRVAPTPDLIFYDPFSPVTDAAMWTLDCFESVFAACAEHDTELFTYSASTMVRTALLAAGFVVARGAPTGKKPETTLAMTRGAAHHAAARGRVLLGPEWLERWHRSHAKFPIDVPVAGRAALAERVAASAQFRREAPAKRQDAEGEPIRASGSSKSAV
ncbi:MAG: tRNA guanosine(34) transglycosylase Tgt [Deltaproteobacteria bacterium]|nr:tRNA guanosine(34) transglycosylase Tgt [Deltaproteobacteria bacterium]